MNSDEIDISDMIRLAEQGNAEAQFSLALAYMEGDVVSEDINEAYKWFCMAAEQGHADAQYELGSILLIISRGPEAQAYQERKFMQPIKEDKHTYEACKWFRMAAEQGHIDAQSELGKILFAFSNGSRTRPERKEFLKESIKWLHIAAANGQTEAMRNLSECYYTGWGVDSDDDKASYLMKCAAEQGNADAQYEFGDHLLFLVRDKSNGLSPAERNEYITEAIKWIRKAAEQGHDEALMELAGFYEEGKFFNQNEEKVFKLYYEAAEQGNVYSQYHIGDKLMLLAQDPRSGLSETERNEYRKESFNWFLKAAENGYNEAQKCLAECYEFGCGVKMDKIMAVKWYEKAAKGGNASAQSILATHYFKGEGVEADLFEAVKWWSKAAEQGNRSAQYKLALCYRSGTGVEKNILLSNKLLRESAKQGFKPAIERLEEFGIDY